MITTINGGKENQKITRYETERRFHMENRYELNKQLAQMLKGGVIMDVTTPEQARIAEEAGACAGGHIVGAAYKNQIDISFHPELDSDFRIHRMFLERI